jgi:drug/metabolite transporter (DMT)-like permease
VAVYSTRTATAELLLGAGLWGFGFVASRWAMAAFGPLTLTAARFGLACLVGLVFCLCVPSLRRSLSLREWKLSFSPGFFLGLTLVLQNYGLQYTSIAKSGFITCLYVITVPLISRFFLKHRLPHNHFIWVLVSLVGAALVCELDSFRWNGGDALTLACSFAAALQILEVGRLCSRSKSPFVFTLGQAFWASLLPLAGAWAWESLPAAVPPKAWWGLAELVFGASLLSFFIQLRAQRILSASTVSLLFLLESPFAAFFGFWLEGEILRPTQLCGALLILAAAAFSVWEAEAHSK